MKRPVDNPSKFHFNIRHLEVTATNIWESMDDFFLL